MLMALMCLIAPAHAKRHRSHQAIAEFKRQHPCPSTGKTRGACPGWTIDHRQALCVGGADEPSNMRWQTDAAALDKDRWECKPGWRERLQACEAASPK